MRVQHCCQGRARGPSLALPAAGLGALRLLVPLPRSHVRWPQQGGRSLPGCSSPRGARCAHGWRNGTPPCLLHAEA